MAHWAKIDNDGLVVDVTVGNNSDPDEGYQWLVENLGGTWVQTSYNGNIRKNYAGIGFTYDEARDVFIPPQPYASWLLDDDTCLWVAPTPEPEEGLWDWDEDSVSWIEI